MSTITYDVAGRPGDSATVAPAPKLKGRFARVLARLVAARQRQAMVELRRHGLRLPLQVDEAGWALVRSGDTLPFVR